MSSAAVFVDRDGVINELVVDPASGQLESPLAAQDVALSDGAAAGLARLRRAGWRLIGVSNQPAAAKGVVAPTQVHAVQRRVMELLSDENVRFDDFRLCLHHPDGVVAGLSGRCVCRKPAPGMLIAAAHELDLNLHASWMVGDTDADMLAGRAAGCRTILVENAGSAHKRTGAVLPDATVGSLSAAADFILRREE